MIYQARSFDTGSTVNNASIADEVELQRLEEQASNLRKVLNLFMRRLFFLHNKKGERIVRSISLHDCVFIIFLIM